MPRILWLASLGLLLCAATSQADYLLIKINVNQLNIFPQMGGGQPAPGPGGIQPGVFPALQPGGIVQFPPGLGDDPNAKWVSGWVEGKFLVGKEGEPMSLGGDPRLGMIWQFDYRGKKLWFPFTATVPTSPLPQMYGGRVKAETFASAFSAGLSKAKKDPSKNVEKYLHLARVALSRSRLADFHKAMKEAGDLEPKNVQVANYLRVQKELARAVKPTDPTQTELIEELRSHSYKPRVSDQGHYCIYAPVLPGDDGDKLVKRRLALMEESLESFYYWFTVQKGNVPQPPLPKIRLTAVLCGTKDDFIRNQVKWGNHHPVADGFTPRRDNVIVMSAKPRLRDPHYAEFESVLTAKLQDANRQLAPKLTLTREDLLSGRINQAKEASAVGIFIAVAQTAVLLAKTLEDEGERATVSHEVVRQLLISSEMYPRNVQIPDWMVEGLASMFETPMGALHPTVGTPSWTHLISFKHLRASKRIPDSANDVMFNVVTDRYFQEARRLSTESVENPKSEALHVRSQQAWDLARSTSWAFVYYLKETRKLEYLFDYGKELNKLPRDMDLDSAILQTCFAEAFKMKDPKDARRIEREPMAIMANSWFSMMQETNHENLAMHSMSAGETSIQAYLLQRRTKLEGEVGMPAVAVATPGTPGVGIPGVNPPPFVQPGVNPPPFVQPGVNPLPPVNLDPQAEGSLAGSTWTGKTNSGNAFTILFQAGNQMTLKTPSFPDSTGTWNLAGNTITISITAPAGAIFTGTINGNAIQASNAAVGKKNKITWNLTRNPDGNPMPPPLLVPPGVNPPPVVDPLPPVVSPMPPVNPGPTGLVGSTWSGSASPPPGFVGARSKFSVQFAAGGKVSMTTTVIGPNGVDGLPDTADGTWAQTGNRISMKFGDRGNYTGTINGNVMQGIPGPSESRWSASKAPQQPGVNPPPPVIQPAPQPPLGQPVPPPGIPGQILPMPENQAPALTAPGGQPGTNVWIGAYDAKGPAAFNLLTMQLNPDGKGVATDREGFKNGTWTLTGNSFTFAFDHKKGNGAFSGTLNGDSMAGSMTQGATNMNWTVKLQKAGAIGGFPGAPPPLNSQPPQIAPQPPQIAPQPSARQE